MTQQQSPSSSVPEAQADAAAAVIQDVVRSVQRAADSGDWLGALDQQRHRLSVQLKTLQQQKEHDASSGSSAMLLQTGAVMLQSAAKAVVETVEHAGKAVQPMFVPPERRSIPGEKVVYGRVGRVVIRDARIFWRDRTQRDQSQETAASPTWKPPIVIQRVVIRASEFCPSLSAKDEVAGNVDVQPDDDGHERHQHDPDLPALYQPLDRYIDVVWKRVLAVAAKSEMGKLFQAAMADVAAETLQANSSSSSNTTGVVDG
jgi:hypothetical protein